MRGTRSMGTLVMAALLAACGASEDERSSGDFPAQVRWTSQPDARSYRVQAWAGLRLLFEESTADTVLPLTPALRRAMAPFDSCRIEVRVAGEGGPASDPPEVFWLKRADTVDGAGGGARTHTN